MTESDIQDFLSLFPERLMKLTVEEQKLSIALYRLLAKGRSVSMTSLAEASGQSTVKVRSISDRWGGEVQWDENGNIVGFFGLSLNRTAHKLVIDGRTLYTWCAWDTLFIPELLDQTVKITSTCPVTSQEISLEISPSGIQSIEPKSTVVSLIAPDPNKISENVIGTFCCHVHFFASPEIGNNWAQHNPGTYIVSLDDAFILGQRKNQRRYPNVFTPTQ